MLTVDEYAQIRLAHRNGMSIREIARQFRHSRRKIREVLTEAQPTPYTRTTEPIAPVLGSLHKHIDAILAADEAEPNKQRHTAQKIFELLQKDHAYTGSYDQVRRYVAKHRRMRRETFIPLSHDPGQRLEADFGHIYVDFPQGRQLVPVLIATWAYSNHGFAMAMPSERTESILAGMVTAFEFFGCVPREVWWDNPKTVATLIFKGRSRQLNEYYQALASHYIFEALFCMPRRGNEKPHAETKVRVLQRRWGTPVPKVNDLDELNRHLRQSALADQQRTVQGYEESMAVRFERDRAQAQALPGHRFDACVKQAGQVDKFQRVRFDCNRYSVPRHCAFQAVTVKGYPERIEVVAGGVVVARHQRSYERYKDILDPHHYLETLASKPATLDHAPVFRDWDLPECFERLREQLEARHGETAGKRQYIEVLLLTSRHPLELVQKAVEEYPRAEQVSLERIAAQVQRLAVQGATETPPLSPATPGHDLPRPDLGLFDKLLEEYED